MPLKRALAIIAAVGSIGAASPQTFNPNAYVDKAIKIVRENAIVADKVDWLAVTAEMHRRAAGARNTFALWPVLDYLTSKLPDNHSFLQLGTDDRKAYQAAEGTPWHYTTKHKQVTERYFTQRTDVITSDLPVGRKQARWVVVPSFEGSEAEANALIKKISGDITARPASCGYIVDFRGNDGGNMWPMLAGLSPFLRNGDLGAFVGRKGRDTIFHRHGSVGMRADGKEQIISSMVGWRPSPLQTIPIAMLVDGGSASSGEITPIMFEGRPHTRFFGTPTYGVATATNGFPMSDGANLVIATSNVADRTGKVYPDGLTPDVRVKYNPAAGRDDPLNTARDWLARQPSCRHR